MNSRFYRTKKEIEEKIGECSVENNVIENIDIEIIAHFGNSVSLNLLCYNIRPLPLYNSTNNIGYIIRALVVLLGKEREDGINLTALKGTPIRIVFNKGGRSVAIGHYMRDQFVLIEDLMKADMFFKGVKEQK